MPSDNEEATTSPEEAESVLDSPQRERTYTFENVRGWRGYRVLQPGKGMFHDVRRRFPFYWSDITDALTYRTFASIVRIYFVK
jgi:boron transporter